MRHLALRSPAVVFTVLALAWRAPAGELESELAFRPAKDSQARKQFSERTTWRVTELTQVMNDVPVTAPAPEISGASERKLVVLDRYVEVGPARPKLLRRTFEELSGESRLEFEFSGMNESVTTPLASALSDARVEFTCGDGEAPCKARFAEEGGGDTALLAGLAEDLDLRSLLPLEDVGVEDRWTLDSAELARVLAPGGELALDPSKGAAADSELLDPLEIAATVLCTLWETSGELSGEVEAVWSETTKVDGRALAVIELDWDSSAKCDSAERVQQLMRAAGWSTEREDVALEWDVASEGSGKLLWDLAAGRAHSFELELDSTLDCRFLWSEEAGRVGYRFKVEAKSKLAASFQTP